MWLVMECRYAAGDKVESWLLELLCLNAAEHVPKLPARLPHPTECDLYYINRDTLFSYHKVGSLHLHPAYMYVAQGDLTGQAYSDLTGQAYSKLTGKRITI